MAANPASPARWRIIECGAHDGTLAADVLGASRELDPAAFAALEYVHSRAASPASRRHNGKPSADFDETVRFLSDPAELAADPLPGIAFGNELLDALPFHLVEWHDGRWLECRVALAPDGGFAWQTAEIRRPAC